MENNGLCGASCQSNTLRKRNRCVPCAVCFVVLTWLCSKPVRSVQQSNSLLLEIHFNITLRFTPLSTKSVSHRCFNCESHLMWRKFTIPNKLKNRITPLSAPSKASRPVRKPRLPLLEKLSIFKEILPVILVRILVSRMRTSPVHFNYPNFTAFNNRQNKLFIVVFSFFIFSSNILIKFFEELSKFLHSHFCSKSDAGGPADRCSRVKTLQCLVRICSATM